MIPTSEDCAMKGISIPKTTKNSTGITNTHYNMNNNSSNEK